MHGRNLKKKTCESHFWPFIFAKINSAQGLEFSKVFFDFHLDKLAKCKVLATFTWPKSRLVEHWSFIALCRLEFFSIATMKWKHVVFLYLQCFLDVIWWMFFFVLWWEFQIREEIAKKPINLDGHQQKEWLKIVAKINKAAEPLSNWISRCSKLLPQQLMFLEQNVEIPWRLHWSNSEKFQQWRIDSVTFHGFAVSLDV